MTSSPSTPSSRTSSEAIQSRRRYGVGTKSAGTHPLKLSRLQARVPSARFVARARLPDGRLSLNKRGRDGSGKANLAPEGGAGVWGVLYDVEPEHWTCLDGHEQGYARADVRVEIGRASRRERV